MSCAGFTLLQERQLGYKTSLSPIPLPFTVSLTQRKWEAMDTSSVVTSVTLQASFFILRLCGALLVGASASFLSGIVCALCIFSNINTKILCGEPDRTETCGRKWTDRNDVTGMVKVDTAGELLMMPGRKMARA